MNIRKTTENDIEICGKIYNDARKFMRESGNADQWNNGYPNKNTVAEDIRSGVSYVCEEDGEILAIFMFAKGEDPTYKTIYEGAWLDDAPYAVIHRIAVAKHGSGIRRSAGGGGSGPPGHLPAGPRRRGGPL